jgi:hypothetical protein
MHFSAVEIVQRIFRTACTQAFRRWKTNDLLTVRSKILDVAFVPYVRVPSLWHYALSIMSSPAHIRRFY